MFQAKETGYGKVQSENKSMVDIVESSPAFHRWYVWQSGCPHIRSARDQQEVEISGYTWILKNAWLWVGRIRSWKESYILGVGRRDDRERGEGVKWKEKRKI